MNVLVCGIKGRMGSQIVECAPESGIDVSCGIDIESGEVNGIPVYDSFDKVPFDVDCIIDFSNHSLIYDILGYAKKNGIPAVIASTGHTEEELDFINSSSKVIPVFKSGNMSLGINVLINAAKYAASVLGNDFDIEIVEMHHGAKLDAPSGTALMIANEVSEVLPYNAEYVYDRTGRRCARPKEEIGIHSLRGGTVIGEHEIIFSGKGETVKISHSAQSRQLFARGALAAARFVKDLQPGMYGMKELLAKSAVESK